MIPSTSTERDPAIQAAVDRIRNDKRSKPGDVEFYLREMAKVDPAPYMTGGDNAFLRALGLTGRAGVQGVGNLVGMPFSMLGAGLQAAGINPPEILRPQGQAAADQLGLPEPRTPGERMAVAGGEGAITAIPFAAAGAPGASVLLGAGSGVAGQGAAEMGASPEGQMLASMAVGMGVPVAGALGAEAIRHALAGSASQRAASRQAQALFEVGTGASPTLGQVAQGGFARTVEGGLRNVPGATQTFRRALDEQANQIGRRTAAIAGRYSMSGTPTIAGQAVRRGIQDGFVPQFRAKANQLYNQIFRLVPEDTPVLPSNTINLFARQSSAYKAADVFDGLDHPWLQKWSTNLSDALQKDPQGIPLGVLKDFRSRLGEMLTGADLVDGLSLRDVKMLYGAVSDDMRTAIVQKGGAPAAKAWDRASNFWKAGTSRLETVLQPLIDKNTPEQAFNALMSGTRDGATVLRSTMRSLSIGEKRLVAATVLRRLGKSPGHLQNAAGDVFSPETYLTNWAKLSPESKMALFEGVDPMLIKDLNTLGKSLELIRGSNRALPNPSGTASNTAFWSIINGLSAGGTGLVFGGPGTALTTGAIGATSPALAAGTSKFLAEKVFTNPKAIRWLVRQTKVPFGALGQELAILAKDAKKWAPEDREVAEDMVAMLGNVNWPQVFTARAVADATAARQ